jgi:two-component system OmpR family sensor kinase
LSGLPGLEKFALVEDMSGKILARTENLNSYLPSTSIQSLISETFSSSAHFRTITLAGHRVRAVFYPFKDQKGTPLVGVVGSPTAVSEGTISQIRSVVFLVMFSSIAIAVAVSASFSAKVASPLEQLSEHVKVLDPENPAQDVVLNSPYTEVETIAEAIDQMSSRVSGVLAERSRTISAQRQFIADVSHELRTPVSNASGTLEVAVRKIRQPEEYVEAIETARSEIGRMNRLINDLLMLAKSDSGNFIIEKEPVDLVDIIKHAVAVVARTSEAKPVVQFNLPAELTLLGDRDRLRQAIDNLLRNSFLHTAGVVRIDLSRDAGKVELDISNDGPQLSPEDCQRIFERFSRLDRSRHRDTGGSGLGLSIVQAIIESHGGIVEAHSDGVSTHFVLTLPV